MGSAGLRAAVADAGPLIHLTEIGALSLLRVFQRIVVPSAVRDETIGRQRVSAQALDAATSVEIRPILGVELATFIEANSLGALHRGEQECLAACTNTGIPVLLTDDLSARDAATRLGLTPVGSLGVVVRACGLGEIALDDAERYVIDLHRVSTLFVTSALVDFVLNELRRGPR